MERRKKTTSIQVRMPAGLKEWLKEKASENFRSLNGEIIARLEGGKDAILIEVETVLTDNKSK